MSIERYFKKEKYVFVYDNKRNHIFWRQFQVMQSKQKHVYIYFFI